MPIRTTGDAVQTALLTDYDRALAPPLTRFIKAASLLIDRVQTCAAQKGKDLTADELYELETWVAAHCYMVAGQMMASRNSASGGPASPKPHAVGMRLEETEYGRMALLLDTSGCLTAYNNRAVASLDWVGLPPSQQTDYEDRN